ncbi:FecR family protein [Pedobacter sp. MC2016-24]|uniref:FecR family protein n=1 Tax=Pedobacter sp. MC2016-24 TaxID=2780090 RepID=UPI001880C13E|nr:FecR domain-containing protein [Pedobacter sp. MC2016-24]MBE9601366.1 DUF4974 domain-containing protein [Pedobacter sp. MC2016-24]
MDKERVGYLYQRHLDQVLTGAELAELKVLAMDPEFLEILQNLTENLWYDDEQAVEGIDSVKARSFYEYIVLQPQQKRKLKLWPRFAVAAAVTVIAFGTWFYTNQIDSIRNISASGQIIANDIAPGGIGATLTLANGEKVRLTDADNGELARQAGVTVTKSASGEIIYEITSAAKVENQEGAINTLSTARGETYKLRLPDGSRVWLNAASSITYSANLLQLGKRKVTLQGEGYFEISKNKAHPFVVESKGQQVEVLGTHFNIKAYGDEPAMATTLLEGSVMVSQASKKVILKPGQQALNKDNVFAVAAVDIDEAVAWKNGLFMFKGEKISDIMKKVQRWYDVDIVYNDGNVGALKFSGTISRYDHVSKLLDILETTGLVHFKIEGRRIIVMK